MRDTKHLGKHANKLAQEAKEKALFRTQRKAVEAGAHGTLDYTIKEGVNKNKVNIDMTLTSPNCPVAESLPKEVKDNILKIEGVSDVNLNLVWEPPWDKDRMSEAAKLELNL